MSGRLTPPSIQDGPYGFEPRGTSNFDVRDVGAGRFTNEMAVRIGRETYESSTNWLAQARRQEWATSLRAFQSLHPTGSKFLSGEYRYRSRLYRPKTRAMVRRDEAATAAAFFSNEDVVSISAEDDDDPRQQASAEILKALLQYRLTNTIPWFLTLIGARQDAEVMGICVGKAQWRYEEKFLRTERRPRLDASGQPMFEGEAMLTDDVDIFRKVKDEPEAILLAPENFRFEPGADWRKPVETSPYLIELQPVYLSEARERMESQRGAPPEWLNVPDSALRGASDRDDDTTRRARESGRVPGKDGDAWKPRDFDLTWTRIHTVRWGGEDWYYRTLASAGELLEPPRPLSEVHLHGVRPYVVGCVVLETHKTYPSSKVELTVDLQSAANRDWNARFDAVMLNLMPRQFVRNGADIDPADIRTFMPGKVVMMNGKPGEPLNNEVVWDRPPPPDAAAFAEQDRINLDWDDLTGAFTNSSVQASQVQQQSATGMHLMSGEASGLGEYELRMFGETWVEPMLKLFLKLVQAYETDPIILATAGKKAQLFQKFGINSITDELLNTGVTTKVNVGIGATNPSMKLRNLIMGAEALAKLYGPQTIAMGSNFEEVANEVFGLLGYKDGARFFQPGFDPRVAMLQQQLQQAQGKAHAGAPAGGDPTRTQTAQITAQGKIEEQRMKSETDEKVAQMDANSKKMAEDAENWRTWVNMQRELMTAQQPVSQENPQ